MNRTVPDYIEDAFDAYWIITFLVAVLMLCGVSVGGFAVIVSLPATMSVWALQATWSRRARIRRFVERIR